MHLALKYLKASWHHNPERLLIIIALLGIIVRFVNLATKEFWIDEVAVLSLVSNTRPTDVFTNQLTTAGALMHLVQLNPATTFGDVLQMIRVWEPVHPPLFYSLSYFLLKFFQPIPPELLLRGLSAIFGALQVVAVYVFCAVFFRSRLFAVVAMSIFAWSPLMVMYAQEARPYSLIALLTFLAATPVASGRLTAPTGFLSYCLTMIAFWYTSFHASVIAFSHAAYSFVKRKARGKLLLSVLFANVLAFAAFVPWLLQISGSMKRVQEQLGWLNERVQLTDTVRGLFKSISVPIYDPTTFALTEVQNDIAAYVATGLIVVISIVMLFRRRADVKVLIGLNLLLIPILLLIQDLLFGGIRVRIPRYQIIALCMELIAVANLIYMMLRTKNGGVQSVGAALLILVLGMEMYSCSRYLTETIWHDKVESGIRLYKTAHIINAKDNITVFEPGDRRMAILNLSLLRYLSADRRILPLDRPTVQQLPKEPTFFIFQPSTRLKNELRNSPEFITSDLAADTGLVLVTRLP